MSELQNKILTAEPVPCSTHPILYDETKCVGCNACVNICQVDILIPSPEKGKHPIVLYPPASATTAAHASWRARTTVPSASSTPS